MYPFHNTYLTINSTHQHLISTGYIYLKNIFWNNRCDFEVNTVLFIYNFRLLTNMIWPHNNQNKISHCNTLTNWICIHYPLILIQKQLKGIKLFVMKNKIHLANTCLLWICCYLYFILKIPNKSMTAPRNLRGQTQHYVLMLLWRQITFFVSGIFVPNVIDS